MVSAYYSYGAKVSSPQSRATRLVIFDGTETVFVVIGSVLSPYIKNHLGLYFSYGLKCGCTFLALLYLIFCVKEVPKNITETKDVSNDEGVSILQKISLCLKEYLFQPFISMVKTLFKRRPYGLHILIAIQYLLFISYVVTWSELQLRYFYMLKTFEGFDGEMYSRFNAFTCGEVLRFDDLFMLPSRLDSPTLCRKPMFFTKHYKGVAERNIYRHTDGSGPSFGAESCNFCNIFESYNVKSCLVRTKLKYVPPPLVCFWHQTLV